MTFQVEGEHLQRQADAQHGGVFGKGELFLHHCDRGSLEK